MQSCTSAGLRHIRPAGVVLHVLRAPMARAPLHTWHAPGQRRAMCARSQGSLLTHVACFSLRTCSSSLQKWQSSTAFSPPHVSGTADDMLPQKRAAP